MNTPPVTVAASDTPTTTSRRVIDAPTRMFHWLFALSFLGAYLSAEGERWRMLHVTLGYLMVGLLVFRGVYGLIGPRQARWSALWAKLQSGPEWLRGLARVRRWADLTHLPWRQGQNLFMSTAVMLLLLTVIPLTLTGYATFNEWGGEGLGEWLGEMHESLGEAYWMLVLAHLGGLLGLSLWRRHNLTTPMFTGRIQGRGPDVARHNHTGIAILLLLAALAYVAWEWTQSPQLSTTLESRRR